MTVYVCVGWMCVFVGICPCLAFCNAKVQCLVLFGLWIHAPQCSVMLCVILKPKTKKGHVSKPKFHMPPLSCCWSWKFVSISFPLWKYKKTYIATPLWVPLNSLMNMIYMVSLLSRCSEKPTNGPQGMRAHAYMINRSITSISASLMWHHNILSLLLWSGLVISIQGTAAKPAGTSHTRRPNTSQALFDASVYKHGDSLTVLFQSTLMGGLQLSVTDRHLGERDS